MLEKIFISPWIIAEHREGPLGRYSDAYAQWLIDTGYSAMGRRPRMGVVSDLNRWLKTRGLQLKDLTPRRVARFSRYRASKVKNFHKDSHVVLGQLLNMLRADGAIPRAPERRVRRDRRIDRCLAGFVRYLKEEKGFSQAAALRYGMTIRDFHEWRFCGRRIVLRAIRAEDIGRFIICCRRRYSEKNVQFIASIMRAYFRFLFAEGTLKRDLSGAITSIPCQRAKHLPVFLEPDEVGRFLKCVHRPTMIGRRNYAMVLLMLRLGLRASEVINLTLDDVNWEQGTLTISGKGHKRAVLPLPQDVGSALACYVKQARPRHVPSRNLFLRNRAPHGRLNSLGAIGSVVRRTLIAAGLRPAQMGAHLLRYTAATQSLRRGATLSEVRDLLRHHSIDTTALYAKVDLRRLRQLATRWPAA